MSGVINSAGGLSVGVPYVLSSSTTPVSCPADSTEDTLATITVPAGSMGKSGMLRITAIFSFTGSTNVKTCRIRFSGASGDIYYSSAISSSVTLGLNATAVIMNSATNTQTGFLSGIAAGYGSGTIASPSGSVDTTADTTVVITGQKATAGETLSLTGYLVELIKG